MKQAKQKPIKLVEAPVNHVAFIHKGNYLAGYSWAGTFAGEMISTRDLLAYEKQIPENEIEIWFCYKVKETVMKICEVK